MMRFPGAANAARPAVGCAGLPTQRAHLPVLPHTSHYSCKKKASSCSPVPHRPTLPPCPANVSMLILPDAEMSGHRT
eukprot:12579240-Alexandrium_andersonii.AAC.1